MTAVILAAGLSRRFGKDKLLADIGGKPMVLHVIELVAGLGFHNTILVYRQEEVKRLAKGHKIQCVYNAHAEEGLSTSVVCAVKNAPQDDSYIFFPGDQPSIDKETVTALKDAYYSGLGTIIVPAYRGRKGSPVIFDYSWKAALMLLDGDTGGRCIIENNPDEVYMVVVKKPEVLFDIDTQEDYLNMIQFWK